MRETRKREYDFDRFWTYDRRAVYGGMGVGWLVGIVAVVVLVGWLPPNAFPLPTLIGGGLPLLGIVIGALIGLWACRRWDLYGRIR